jgi:hypothetical protein
MSEFYDIREARAEIESLRSRLAEARAALAEAEIALHDAARVWPSAEKTVQRIATLLASDQPSPTPCFHGPAEFRCVKCGEVIPTHPPTSADKSGDVK